jgi:hypothetical protein
MTNSEVGPITNHKSSSLKLRRCLSTLQQEMVSISSMLNRAQCVILVAKVEARVLGKPSLKLIFYSKWIGHQQPVNATKSKLPLALLYSPHVCFRIYLGL